jgi:hypothetical protein
MFAPFFLLAIGILGQLIDGMPINVDPSHVGWQYHLLLVAMWAFLMIASVPRAYAFLQQFSVDDEGVQRKVLGRRTVIPWGSIELVEKRKAPHYAPVGWSYKWVDETSLRIRARSNAFLVYDSLVEFDEFKSILSSRCRRLGIKQLGIDQTIGTIERLKKEDRALYRRSRRRGLRTEIQQL